MGDLSLFKPWVEGVDGYGIGEKIFINYSNNKNITGFYLSNGFVSIEKPYLYEKNSRIKKILVYNSTKSFQKTFKVEDTPNIQFFDVPQTNALIIEILDVYRGSLWEDTCINFILPESDKYR
ncbi:MAG: hypothetical protein PQJ46_04810 [Spirochaetales bacterium]|nr:hypothetical protein [Spirochaetales bacterium]